MKETEQILAEVHKKRLEETRLYDNFEKYYRKREFAKASEFLWGSISKLAYAIGLFYGKKLGKHGEIISLMKDLAKAESEIMDWVSAAESLHSNFYHNWMEEGTFEHYVRKGVDLRMWLIRMLDDHVEKMGHL